VTAFVGVGSRRHVSAVSPRRIRRPFHPTAPRVALVTGTNKTGRALLSHGGGGRRGTSSPAAESRPPESSCSPPRCLHFESRGYIPDVGGPEIRGSRFRSCRAGSRKLNPHSRSASASRRRAGSGAAAAAAMKPSPHFPEIGKKPKGTLGLLPATNPLRTQRRLCLRGHFVSLKK
jgi:hypothetical protein